MIITLLSDTHRKHKLVTNYIPKSDLILHAGDISSMGHEFEINEFVTWYDSLPSDNKIFIAGNHDWGFQNNIKNVQKILNIYKSYKYLQDNSIHIKINNDPEIKIYGTPHQPYFCNWAFNLPRNGKELKEKWSLIPNDTDILITHTPAYGILDDVENKRGIHLGCELLTERIKEIKPKIHICGHIHSGRGYYFDGNTHFFNASVLGEQYEYAYTPFVIDWDPITNTIEFIKY